MTNPNQAYTITSAQYSEANRLFNLIDPANPNNGRVNYYTYMYGITGNKGFQTLAEVSSSSGSLTGGPAWVFNGILQGIDKEYPQDANAIERFSIDIGFAIKNSTTLNTDGTYSVKSELDLYNVAGAVWDQWHLGRYAPPDLEAAITLLGQGQVVDAGRKLMEDAGYSGFLIKTIPEAAAFFSENLGITNQGKNFYDLLIQNPTATVQQVGDSYAVKNGETVLGLFTVNSIKYGESIGLWALSPVIGGAILTNRVTEISSLSSRLPPELRNNLNINSPTTWETPNIVNDSKVIYTFDATKSSLLVKEVNASGNTVTATRSQFMDGKTITTRLNTNLEPTETATIYTVQSGDTLSAIAQNKGTTVAVLQANNPQITNPNQIIAGENIYIPLAVHNIGNTWTVGTGATGDLIAAASGITLSQLQAANPGVNVVNPPQGTVLNLPTVQNGLLNFTNSIDSNGAPKWNTGNVDNSAPNGANDFVFSEGAFTGFFTGASNNGIHNVAGSIVTDGWMPGAEVFSSINFISDNTLPSSGFYTGGAWSSYGINLGSNYNYGIDLGAATFNNFSFSAYSYFGIDPLVLDLNGDGVKLTDYDSAPVLFDIDHDASGSLEQTGWVSAQDGILVHDLNNNGKIDNISETISEYYTGAIGVGSSAGQKKYSNGFTALKSLDSNNDNQFTAADATYTQLRVWQDANHDGKTDAGELKTLASLGITSISLSATAQSGLVNGGNEILATGSFVQSGITKQAQAVNLLANPVGHTFSVTATGARITSDNGLQSYVSHIATGEVIDFAKKGIRNGYGNNGNDTLIGDANSNWLVGGQGSDTFDAGAGDDVLLIDANDQQGNIHAGAGLDIAQVVGDASVVLNLAQAELEVAIGGRGDDILIGGGRSNVFISGGEGDDIIIGGAADDALSGEEGADLIDGGAGDDLIRGHSGRDQLIGGTGDDLIEGGLDDDNLSGGTGNDLLKGEQGDDKIDGGDGYDVVKLAGSYADYRITQINNTTFRIVDTKTGRDGADTLTNIEAVTFSDIGNIKLSQPIVMAVDDSISVSSGAANYVITKASLFDNDLNLNGGILQLKSFGDEVGGVVSQNGNGDFVFTPTAGYAGVMSFTYVVQTSAGQFIAATLPNGQSAPLKATVTLKTPNLPTDPLFAEQRYLNDVKVVQVWKDYTGKGVRIGQFEPNAPFQTNTTTFDYRHPDLQANTDQSWLASGTAPTDFSNHATMVAGIMVAAKDGQGTVGVAYDAKLSGISTGSSNVAQNWSVFNQWQNYDVVNNSWGAVGNFAANYLFPDNVILADALQGAAVNGRHGLGTSVVFSAGNERAAGIDANSMLSNSRFAIQVGSINQVGDLGTLSPAVTPYSNRGASILVSAPGSNVTTTSRLLINDQGSVFGSDAKAVNGTSFAAPVVTGVIALMLEANPNLGYRDIQEILALSAAKVATDPSAPTDWVDNHATNWNGGGMHTSHDYGFGQVDARAAVRLAESWMRTSVIGNGAAGVNNEGALDSGVISPNAVIPANGTTYTQNITMAAGLSVEHVELLLDIDHQKYGDLIVKLISPTGTESVLMNRLGNGNEPGNGELRYVFSSTHDWGETSGGVWKVQITDAAAGNVGTLKILDLKLYGKNVFAGDDAYYYTDEFVSVGTGARLTLADTNNGLDTINAAAVTSNTTVNLTAGSASIAGKAVTITSPANFENVFGGDGADTLTGNAGTNRLSGGRGNDAISGAAGGDILEGGQGNDTLTGGTETDMFVIRKDAGSADIVTDFSVAGREKVALVGFGALNFSGLTKTQVGANTVVDLGGGQTIQLNNVTATSLTADNFNFFDNFNFARQYIGTNAADSIEFPVLTALPNLYLAGAGNDTVWGGYGQDVIYGEDGNDILLGDVSQTDTNGAGDIIYGGAGDDTIAGGYGDDMLYGGAGLDTIYGDAGFDTIYLEGDTYDIPTGKYAVFGGADGDRFVLTNTTVSSNFANLIADFNPLDSNEKIDLSAITSITTFNQLTLEQIDFNNDGVLSTRIKTGVGNSPSLILYGVALNKVVANNFIFYQPPLIADLLNGNAGGNRLIGTTGADSMIGRMGDDTYIVDNLGDTIIELAGSGYDAVQSSVTHILAENVEQLTLTGTNNIDGTGNSEANRLVGNTGNNIIDGKGGADDMVGGAGNDIYIIDTGTDRVTENLNEGTDSVQSSVSWTLGKNLENLTLTGFDDINATGNELVNTLVGNATDNILDGAQGADILQGGSGNDTYYVDNAGDTITELVGGGYDTVYSSVNISTLNTTSAAQVEQLILAVGATQGTGNALDNVLIGNDVANTLSGLDGADYLDGGLGADNMTGGLGNDTYVVDNAGDVVTETSTLVTEIDTVQSSITLSLATLTNVENLTLTGIAAINATGNTLANILIGNSAINTLTGGTGNDTYVVDNTGDIVSETSTLATEIDTVQSSATYTLSANVENLTLIGTTAINGTGNASANILTGNAGNNTLNGAAGIDTLNGGYGDDIYIVDTTTDIITEDIGAGTDTVQSSVTFSLASIANVENLTLTGTAAINATGNTLANVLTGNSAINTLTGGTGNDTYVVDNTGDVVSETSTLATEIDTVQSSATYTLSANVENLTLTGTTAINGTGNGLNNILTGNAGNNTLDGAAGIDTMVGGLGNDIYLVDNVGDVVTETSALITEIDTVQSSVTYTLGNNLENLTLTGTAAISGTGNTLANIITGNSNNNTLNGGAGNDTIDGGAGIDTLIGGAGNDIYLVDTTTDTITETANQGTDTIQSSVTFSMASIANVENLTLTGTAAINATGNGLANVLTGNSAINTLAGGAGNDTYVVDTTTDVITEAANEGTDTVQSSVTFSLASIANVENLTLTGTAAINATGNTLDNVLTGNSAINTLAGGLGNDTYVVDSTADIISEAANAGTDTVQSSVTFSIAAIANVENLSLVAINFSDINGTGNSLNNTLTGTDGKNVLDGGTGVDTLIGGYGDDIYIVDTTTDTIIEVVNDWFFGKDTVQSSVTFSLANIANVENLTLTGTAAINATGNALDNVLIGNSAINTLAGGLGNDTYIVNTTTDIISEAANEGSDTVQSSVTFTLAAISNVENVTLTGTAAIDATGNALANVLIGNSAINTLAGGTGNDTYVIDVGDIVSETSTLATEIDTVQSNISYTLGANLENLTLIGTTALTGTGNALNNILQGNSAANTLIGGAGNDTYVAGTGIYYAPSYIEDTIIENDLTIGNVDTLQLSIIPSDPNGYLSIIRDNNDLVISGTGYNLNDDAFIFYESVRVKNQFLATQYQIENIAFAAGTLPASSVTTVLATYGYDYNATSGNDILIGDTNTKSINGLAGDDSITGSARNDSLSGGDGNDSVLGGAGNDLIDGGNGNDLLNGGIGNDNLLGGTGEDIYEFGRGYGIDTAYDNSSEKSTIKMVGIASTDANLRFERILLNPNYTPVSQLALKITLVDTGESITFSNWWDLASDNTNKFVQFSDVTLNLTDIENRLSIIAATDSINWIMGTSRSETINGGAGHDRIYGFEGDDILNGGSGGADQIHGGSGNDQLFGSNYGTNTLYGDEGNDQLTASIGRNTLYGGTGDDQLTAGGYGQNTLDGGAGADIMTATGSGNTFYVDNVGDQVTGLGTIYSRSANYTMQANSMNQVNIEEGTIGNVIGNASDNYIFGNSQSNLIQGLAGNDYLSLSGTLGFDILQGGVGDDSLVANDNNLGWYVSSVFNRIWDGGTGNDTISTANSAGVSFFSNDFLIGGAGSDTLNASIFTASYVDPETGLNVAERYTKVGNDIVAFNKGDGNDRLVSADGALTLSVGKLTNYSDMSLSKVANDLVLKVGATDSLTFADWYKSSPGYNLKTVQNLQVIAEAMTGFTLGGADQLRNNKIENFNFTNLVAAFDAAGAVANWQLTDTLLTTHLKAGSDSAAIGGDLAYQYGKNSNLTGMGLLNAQSVISSTNFGQLAQAVNDPTVWQAELVKLG